jgi:hypothetical protein
MNPLTQIQNLLEKTPEKTVKSLKIFSRFKYPKLFMLLISIIAAYVIFQNPLINQHIAFLGNFSYVSVFFAGLLFAFGFTAAIAVGFLIALQPGNIFLAALIAGLGALVSDLLIFRFVKVSFDKEFNLLKRTIILRKINKLFKKNLGLKITSYIMYAFTGIIIASPLPDEIGVILLAGLTKINQKILAVISFVLNTIGIFLILYFSG